jgi:hypothetical protein
MISTTRGLSAVSGTLRGINGAARDGQARDGQARESQAPAESSVFRRVRTS